MMRAVLRCDGNVEPLDAPIDHGRVCSLIGADTLDTVALHHLGLPLHVMLVDDNGYEYEVVQHPGYVEHRATRALKPFNAKATELYLRNRPAGHPHQIVGDVVVMPDQDFARGDGDDVHE